MIDYQLTQVKVKKYLQDELMRSEQAQLDSMQRLRAHRPNYHTAPNPSSSGPDPFSASRRVRFWEPLNAKSVDEFRSTTIVRVFCAKRNF